MALDPVAAFAPDDHRAVHPLLASTASQEAQADAARSIDPALIAALKSNDVIGPSATRNIGGSEATTTAPRARARGNQCELHQHDVDDVESPGGISSVRGLSKPRSSRSVDDHRRQPRMGVFPADASSGVTGVIEGDSARLNGKGALGCPLTR